MLSLKVDLHNLPERLQLAAQALAKSSRFISQGAADIFYKAMKVRVDSLGSRTGNLSKSIYQKFSPEKSLPDGVGISEYHVSWNHVTAPHGRLIEKGHIQAFQSFIGKDGKWHTMKRKDVPPGTPKPSRRASFAEKAAYYVVRKNGPIFVLPDSFVRYSFDAKQAEVQAFMRAEIKKIIGDI